MFITLPTKGKNKQKKFSTLSWKMQPQLSKPAVSFYSIPPSLSKWIKLFQKYNVTIFTICQVEWGFLTAIKIYHYKCGFSTNIPFNKYTLYDQLTEVAEATSLSYLFRYNDLKKKMHAVKVNILFQALLTSAFSSFRTVTFIPFNYSNSNDFHALIDINKCVNALTNEFN